jgi:formylglycine-generating enzyme required for sulfatase activity
MKELLQDLLVKIPSGTTTLRDDRIKQQWSVDIESFWLSKFLVTQALYQYVIKENPSSFVGDNLPVENITWKEAVIFCNALSAKMDLY